MGQRLRSLFKKKKNHEPEPAPLPYKNDTPPLIHTQLYSTTTDALTFTHGSLLDDVLKGLKDHQNTMEATPELPPLSTSRHLDAMTKTETNQEQEQKEKDPRDYQQQTIGGSLGNNRTKIYQQNMVTQTPSIPSSAPCRPTPETTFVPPAAPNTPCPPTSIMVTTTTPVPSASTPPPRPLTSPLVTLTSHRRTVEETPTPALGLNDSDISDVPSFDSDLDHQHQKPRTTMINHRPPMSKSPSIISSKPSLESNHDKRNRYALAIPGVSMSRMKERHRQECRRSLQSNSIPAFQQQQLPEPLYQASIPPSPSFQSFQQSPLIQQQQPQKLSQLVQRPYQRPSMEPMTHTMTPSASFSYVSPPPPNNIVRSSSVMTDMYLPSPSPSIEWTQHPAWRQQPLFPFQSDFVLPSYNPAMPSQPMMMYPPPPPLVSSPSTYRISSEVKQEAVPRSVSVYGGVKSTIPGALIRAPTMDNSSTQRKSMLAAVPREYQPQLSAPEQQHRPKKQNTAPSIVESPVASIDPATSDPSPAQSSDSSSTISGKQIINTDVMDEEHSVIQSDSSTCTISNNTNNKHTCTSPALEATTHHAEPSDLDGKLEIPASPPVMEKQLKKHDHKNHRRLSLPTLPMSLSFKQDSHVEDTQPCHTTRDNDPNPVNNSTPPLLPPPSAPPAKLQISCGHHSMDPNMTGVHSCSSNGAWPFYAVPSPPHSTPCYGHQHYIGHHGCGHSVTPQCCAPPAPPPPSPPCCSRSHHHHHHHHHPTRSTPKPCHHHHHRQHHRHSKLQRKKSTSMMTPRAAATEDDDDDDAKTIGSTTKSLLDPHLAKQKSPATSKRDDADNETISGIAAMKKKGTTRRASLRAFLPPRFTTKDPTKRLSASKSSYSWIPSRS